MDTRGISVLVQGPIDSTETPACLNSIRTWLPNAEIVLSTWEDSDVSRLSYDEVVFSRDPGCVSADRNDGRFNNLNRELVGVQAGLGKCSQRQVLKTRSDILLSGCGFTKYIGRSCPGNERYRVFNQRVVTISLFTRRFVGSAANRYYTPFHVSDWVHFGSLEDITALWSAPLVDEPGFSRYFENLDERLRYAYGTRTWRFPPEQYIFYTLVNSLNAGITMEHLLDYDDDLIRASDRYVLNNFVVLNPGTFGMVLNKEPYRTCCNDIAALPSGDAQGLYTETREP